jgi:4-amino-4-deoxy-L-arabinose transferase-like glycosyltransferase
MGKLTKVLPVVVLLGLCGLVFSLRLHTYDEPLERDLTTYAVIAHEMLNGKALYAEVWDHKPPAIHVTYAAAELIAGYGRKSIFLMSVLATIGSMLSCYAAGRAIGGGPLPGLLAATLWALVSGDLALEGNQPNTEVFLNCFLTAGFAVVVRSGKNGLGFAGATLAGLFFAIASLYKQIVIAQIALVAITYLVYPAGGSRKKALGAVAILAATGAIAWGAVFAYFAIQGHYQAFIDAVFTYNRWYSADIWRKNFNVAPFIISSDGLWVLCCIGGLAAVGLILGAFFGSRRLWALLVAFAVGAQIAVLLPGWFFQHYYQLWLPPLVIGASWSVAMLTQILPRRLAWLAYATAGVAVATLACVEAPYYSVPSKMWSVKKYGGVFLATDILAHDIDHLLLPGETFYEWGNESGLYFTSGRRPPSGIFFSYPMQDGPLAETLARRVRSDLESAKPELMVVALEVKRRPDVAVELVDWCRENYRPVFETKMFLVLVRKGGRLDRQPVAAVN